MNRRRRGVGRYVPKGTQMEIASRLVSLHQAAIELTRLERLREPALAERLEKAQERAHVFPHSFAAHEVQKLTVEQQDMLDRIDELKAIVRLAFQRMEAA